MTLELFLALAVAAVAVLALMRTRRVSRRLDRLTESYWELRYEYGQLRARLARLEGANDPEPATPAAPAPTTAFIPLTSLKR